MSQIKQVLGSPCNASEGRMVKSKSTRPDKVTLAKGHAKGGSWPAGAHETGISGDTDKMGQHGSPLD